MNLRLVIVVLEEVEIDIDYDDILEVDEILYYEWRGC